MASLSKLKNGGWMVQFHDRTGKRRTVRLGQIPRHNARSVFIRMEELIAAKATGSSPSPSTQAWLNEIGETLYDRLVRVELAEPATAPGDQSLGAFLADVLAQAEIKGSTRTRYEQSVRLLQDYLGSDKAVGAITRRDADGYRAWLVERKIPDRKHHDRKYARAKVSREIGMARQFLKKAVEWNLIDRNPFDGVKAGGQTNPDRKVFVKAETIERVMAATDSHDWRCIIALSRYGGLRCPSEVLRATWGDVYWSEGKMLVRSPKTEHHPGKDRRIIPLFPELRAVLEDAYAHAEDRDGRIVVGYTNPHDTNLRTGLMRILKRAGIEPWPKLFNALRASRATELAAQFPPVACSAWLGHSPTTAITHYQVVTDDDFARATAGTTPTPSAVDCAAQTASASDRVETEEPVVFDENPRKQGVSADASGSVRPCSGSISGRNRTRTCDLFLVMEAR